MAGETRFTPEYLDAHWMAYTGNRQFKREPRMIVGAEDAYLIDDKGRRILDGLSGLWCTGAGHNRQEITEAVHRQLQNIALKKLRRALQKREDPGPRPLRNVSPGSELDDDEFAEADDPTATIAKAKAKAKPEAPMAEEAPVKRKRGRPRKTALAGAA